MTSRNDSTPRGPGLALLLEGAPRMTVGKREFLKSNERASRALKKDLDRFLADPDEGAVHDARIAMRRVDAHLSLLPKAVRKRRKVAELLERHRRAMRRSAKVRDMDIIRGKLSREGRAASGLLRAIDKRRREAASEAREAVRSARAAEMPIVTSDEVTQAGLQRRFEKVVGRLAKKVEALLPVALGDPGRRDELHALRIACKRLRYTLELAPAEDSAEALAVMERWQDALGAIRDWDVTTAYLAGARGAEARMLLKTGTKQRERGFRDMRSTMGQP